MKIYKYKLLGVLMALAIVFNGCDDEDTTGHSSVTPTNPSVNLTVPTFNDLDFGADATYSVAVTLSEPQVVDVRVYLTQVGGDAVEGEDYAVSAHFVDVPAYRTDGGTIDVTLFGSPLRPEAKTLELQVGDDRTANASITPAMINVTLNKTPDCILFPDASTLVGGGSFSELNDDGNPQTSDVTMALTAGVDGGFTITNFAFSSGWWCGHADATLELVLNNCDNTVSFPDGGAGTPQAVGGIDNICGFSGPVVVLNELGTYDPATGVVNFNIEVTVDAGSFGSTDLTYTPQ